MKTTLTDLTLVEAQTYCRELVRKHPRASERKQVFSYLLDLFRKDDKKIRKQQFVNVQLNEFLKSELELHSMDFSKTPSLFLASVLTDAQIIAEMLVDGAEIFLDNRTVVGDVVLGPNVYLQGFSSGSAKTESLVCTARVTGNLTITGSDCVVKGIEFTNTDHKSIQFSGSPQNVTFEDCVFDMNGFHEWFVGDGFGGSVTIKNCHVKNIGSHWFFADFSTASSATPAQKLTNVLVEDCYFDGISSAITARGIQADPNDSVIYRNNKLRFANQDALMWDVFEINNTVSAVCTGNEITGLVKIVDDDLSVLQTWSRAGAWSLVFKDNSVSNANYVVKIAMSSTFYSPTHATSEVVQGTGVVSGADHAVSFVYPWDDPVSNYNPVNVGVYPSPITVDFPAIT